MKSTTVNLLTLQLLLVLSSVTAFSQEPELITRVFPIRPDFHDVWNGKPEILNDDPFADRSQATVRKRPSAQEILEKKGVAFPKGAAAFYNPVTRQLTVRNAAENLSKIEDFLVSDGYQVKSAAQISEDKGLRALVELIEVDQDSAARLIHTHLGKENANALRAVLEQHIQRAEASIIQSRFIRTRLGETNTSAGGKHFHPKDWNQPGRSREDKSPYTVNASAQSFVSNPTGLLVRLNAKPTSESGAIQIRWSIEATELLKKLSYGSGVSEIEKPLFYHQKLNTERMAHSGEWQLLGTFSPPSPKSNSRVLVISRVESGAREGVTLSKEKPQPTMNLARLVEYIDVDAGAIPSLLQEHSPAEGELLLKKVTEWIDAGEATRRETVFLSTDIGRNTQNSSVRSVTRIDYPAELNPPDIMGSKLTGVIPPDANLIVPATIREWKTQSVGTVLSLKGTNERLTQHLELKQLLGFDSWGRQESEVKMPLISSINIADLTESLSGHLQPETMFLGMQVPIKADTKQPDQRRRIVMFSTSVTQPTMR